MMRKSKKRQFHCEKCGLPCEIYKKGKKHRVLVCPRCGVLATNPTALGKIAKGALRSVPFVGDIAAEFVGGKEKKASGMTTTKVININRDEFDTEERVALALK